MLSFLSQIVPAIARKHPDAVAVIEEGRSVTYRELSEKIEVLAARLTEKGFRRGERFGIISRNSIDYITVFFAVVRAGGVAVPLNYALHHSGIAEQAEDSSIAAVYFGRDMEAKAKEVVRKTPSVRFAVSGEDLKAKAPAKNIPNTKPPKLACIIYTSGTTRRPLGVMLSHKNLISNAGAVVKYLSIVPSDRVCCVLQFNYIYGLSLLLSHLLAGATVILDNRFMYPNLVLDTMDKYKATGFAGVSSHYAMLLYASELGSRRLPRLRYFMQAGDRMPEQITKRLLGLFPRKKIYLMYGQTEASPRLTYLDPSLSGKKPGSVGRAIPGVEVKIVNRRGKECLPGEEGQIIARGGNVMLGYWKNRKESKKVMKNGWLYTGDIAYRDKDGDVFIVGRAKNLVKIGGNRVNPGEIEDLVKRDSSVMEAAAVDVQDRVLGRKIKLFVAPVFGKKLSAGRIMRLCRSQLPSYKVPSEVVVVKNVPKNSFGKVDREALRSR